MLKKLLLAGLIAISFSAPLSARAAPNKPPAAKGCKLYGQPVPHGYQIDFQDRWGNTIRSYTCFNGVWLRVLRA